jgi:hypothetical protein
MSKAVYRVITMLSTVAVPLPINANLTCCTYYGCWSAGNC